MSTDPGDLANLADLALPPAISFWPPAAGVLVLGAALGSALAVAGWRALQRYRRDAYLRRAADEIDASASHGSAEVSAVLKRAAMVAYGRERVASLTGPAWMTFLAGSAPAGTAMDTLKTGLQGSFSPGNNPPATGSDALAAEAKAWLRGQRGRVSGKAP